MMDHDKVNILLVDDQPAKLLAYEVILKELGENLVKASSGREALEFLLKNDVAIILVDVCMPELDGFELAAMIREHPRFQKTAMIFISAIQVSDIDRLRGYEMGAVDYVPVPVVPEVLRAKIKVFAELYRKTRQLERLNVELEDRVRARTAELEESHTRLLESEQRRSLAIAAGKMGSWDWDWVNGDWMWDDGQYQILGIDPGSFELTPANIQALFHPDDVHELHEAWASFARGTKSYEAEFRIIRPNGEMRWCAGTAAASTDKGGRVIRVSGVTVDITERKQAEERQNLLAREVDHRAKNALALAQSIVRLTRGENVKSYVRSVEGRINALARVHTVLSLSSWQGAEIRKLIDEELAPYSTGEQIALCGPGDPVRAGDGADGRAGAARTRHQFGKVWRPVDAVGPAVGELGRPGGPSQDHMGGDRRAAGREAGVAGVRNAQRDRQHRVAARRPGGIRLAPGRPRLLPFGPPARNGSLPPIRSRSARSPSTATACDAPSGNWAPDGSAAMKAAAFPDDLSRRRSDGTGRSLERPEYTEKAIVHHGRLDSGVLLLAKPYRKSELARMLRLALAS